MTLIMTLALLAGQTWNEQAEQYRPDPKSRSADGRKEARDRALRVAGREANNFCKHYGELGVQAILACQKAETAKSLVALFDSGELQKLHNAKAALDTVCKFGEPAAVFLVANCSKLQDPDAQQVWGERPLDFSYELSELDQAASERRSARGKGGFNLGQGEWSADSWKGLGIFAGGIAVAGLLGYWLRGKRAAPVP